MVLRDLSHNVSHWLHSALGKRWRVSTDSVVGRKFSKEIVTMVLVRMFATTQFHKKKCLQRFLRHFLIATMLFTVRSVATNTSSRSVQLSIAASAPKSPIRLTTHGLYPTLVASNVTSCSNQTAATSAFCYVILVTNCPMIYLLRDCTPIT